MSITAEETVPGTALERHTGLVEEYRPRILMDPGEAKALDDGLRAAMRAVLTEGTDYGAIPGAGDKKVLMKPGAEKLLQWFGFGFTNQVIDIERDSEGRKYAVTYRCTVTKELADGRKIIVATCDGYAGYDEDRYFQTADDARRKAEKRERANAARYQRQANPSKWDITEDYRAPWNTVIKMAQKRAHVGATIDATAAAGLFTQDLDDDIAQDAAAPEALAEAGRAAIETLPQEVGKRLNDWFAGQKWPTPDKWDTAQWCAALVEAGRFAAGQPVNRPTQAAPGGQQASQVSASAPTATADDLAPSNYWFDDAAVRASTLPDKAAATALWAEIKARLDAGTISKKDADDIAATVKARVWDLDHPDDEGEFIEGTVVTPPVTGLEPGDPWLANIESISSSEDAEMAIADVQQAVKNKSMTRSRADQVIAAISDRKQYLLSQMTRPAA